MADRVISAEMVLKARDDGVGDTLARIAGRVDSLAKAARHSTEVQKLGATLANLDKQAKAVSGLAAAQEKMERMRERSLAAAETVKKLEAQIAAVEKPTARMAAAMLSAQAAVGKANEAATRQARVMADAEKAIAAYGHPLGAAVELQERLRGEMDRTTAAIERQMAADRKSAEVAEAAAKADRDRAKAETASHTAAERRAEGIAHHGIGNYALGAAAGAVSAHGVATALEKALEAGADRAHVMAGMKTAGMGDEEISRAVDLATRVSRSAPNLDVSQILELHKEARSAVQHPEEVFELMPDLARATSVLKGLGADNANIADMVKAGESLGLMNDPKRFHTFLDAQVRAMNVMGKTITTEQVYEAAKYSKSAGATLSDDFLNLTMPSLIQEMHGSSAGDALSALAKRWRGGLAHQHLAVTELDRMGLLEDPSKIVRAKKSGEIMGYTGKLKNDELLGTDPDRFFREVWEPAAEKIGAKTLADKIKLLNETLPGTAANAGRIFLQQAESLRQHRENYRNAPDLERSVEIQKRDPKVAMQTFTASLNDLEAAVTGPAMDALSLGLGGLAGKIRDLADAAKAHPNVALAAGAGAAAVGFGASGFLAYQLSRGFGLRTSANELKEAARDLKGAALAERGQHAAPSSPDDPKKPNGTSFDKGRVLALAAGLAGVVANAPNLDEDGNRERAGNAAALDSFGNALGFGYLDSARQKLFGKDGDAATALQSWWQSHKYTGTDPYRTPFGYDREVHARARLPAGDFHPDDRRDRADVYTRMNREQTFRYMQSLGMIPSDMMLEQQGPPALPANQRPRRTPDLASFSATPADAADRASDRNDAIRKLNEEIENAAPVMGQLTEKSGVLQASFTTLDGGTGALSTSFGTLGSGSAGLKSSLDILAQTAIGAARALATVALNGGGGGGGDGSGVIRASYGGGGSGGGGDGSPIVGGAGTVDGSLPKEARALLDTISSGEAHGYNILNGGGTFHDLSHHPGSRAAGRYQDLPSTWRRISGALGLHDFSPTSQDRGNWWLAQQDYRAHTGRDLLADLKTHDPARISSIGRALHSTWVSTNGTFARKFDHFYGVQHDAEPHPLLRARPPGTVTPSSHATTARLEGKLDRLASAIESGGSLHRVEIRAVGGAKAEKTYSRSRGGMGPTMVVA